MPLLLLVVFISYQWWRDVLRETKAGYHTIVVQRGITIGFLLSEIMLFLPLSTSYNLRSNLYRPLLIFFYWIFVFNLLLLVSLGPIIN